MDLRVVDFSTLNLAVDRSARLREKREAHSAAETLSLEDFPSVLSGMCLPKDSKSCRK